jgi:hypothetical protein
MQEHDSQLTHEIVSYIIASVLIAFLVISNISQYLHLLLGD